MSFRNRLTLFFIVIVVVPMVAVAVVLFQLVSDAEGGKAAVRLSQAQRAAQALFVDARDRAEVAGQRIGEDPALATAIAGGDRAEVQAALAELARRTRAERVRAELDGLGTFEVGRAAVVAPVTTRLVGASPGARIGTLETSVLRADRYAQQVRSTTGLDAVIADGTREIAEGPHRSTGFTARGFGGGSTTVRLLEDESGADDGPWSGTSLVVAAALAGFLLLAFAFAWVVLGSLRAQIQRLLDAARRLGSGDLRVEVPTSGNDEFAALGQEFNSMARQLESRLEELRLGRERLQGAIRRVGESFAKNLDREALLGILVQTAVDGVGADCGRATARTGGSLQEVARAGDIAARGEAVHAAERRALETGTVAEVTAGGASALAQPLPSTEGGELLGVLSVARAAGAFTEPERDLFNYLASQAAVSIENVSLHETVQRQAVTDELTGLFNHRRFQEVMALEVERSRRFGSEVGLVMLDIDNFKKVNDTYGHLQGDLVLREVARVLRDSAREIDEPARYGGEEMAVALPETDLEGAYRFAERVRASIEALELPVPDGNGGGTLRVTASFGAAALVAGPELRQADKASLVAAADAALYRAKRSGKNRTVKAE